MYQPDLMKGQRILVTGGGTGLGQAMAERFLALGADVAICGRRKQVCDETAAAWRERFPGRRIDTFGVDIRVAQAVEEMVEALWQGGGLTGLVNNAAGNFVAPTESLSPRGFDAIANIVFHGTFYVTQAVGKRWVAEARAGQWTPQKPYRSVMSIVVTWVDNGSPYVVPSAMSKAGIEVMTKSLAVEWARFGVRLNAVGPGEIPTEGMSKRLNPGRGAGRAQQGAQPDGARRADERAAEPGGLPDGARPVRLAHRPDRDDGRRQCAGHRRQLLRAARLERGRLAGGARTDRGAEREGPRAARLISVPAAAGVPAPRRNARSSRRGP
jgi:NAD(P)-dependent dehydrogenase (short-subunit alcohol dehydrogenase family)